MLEIAEENTNTYKFPAKSRHWEWKKGKDSKSLTVEREERKVKGKVF